LQLCITLMLCAQYNMTLVYRSHFFQSGLIMSKNFSKRQVFTKTNDYTVITM